MRVFIGPDPHEADSKDQILFIIASIYLQRKQAKDLFNIFYKNAASY